MAGLGIDRYMGGMRAVGIRMLLVEEAPLRRDACCREPCQRNRFAGRSDGLAVGDLDLRRSSQPMRFAACARMASRKPAAADRIAEPPMTTAREW